MSSVCEEQHRFQLQPSHQLLSLKKSLRDIDIPPRKLLTSRAAVSATAHDGGAAAAAADMFSDETLLNKYLPHTKLADSSDDEDSDDPYSSDHFRMYEFKVRRCTRSRSHDWTDCPFAHPGEKARRRDPRRYHYSGTVCPEYRRDGVCRRGDACEFSHGVFECWLHPARYRTEACKDGKSCKRKVCFFAHTPRQLRVLPLNLNSHVPSNDTVSCCNSHNKKNSSSSSSSNKSKFFNNSINSPSSKGSNSNHCCLFCHCCSCSSNSTCSPTSTLFGMSHFSPPMSPSSPASSSHCGGLNHHHGVNVSYKDVLTEIMCSFEGLNFGDASSPVSASSSSSKAQNVMPWLHDVCCEDHQLQKQFVLSPPPSSFGCEDHKQRFILSPTINSSAGSPSFSNGGYSSGRLFRDESNVVDDVSMSSCPAPDLGWVNELLM